MDFVMRLRTTFPQFDQRSERGAHMQQDAEVDWFFNSFGQLSNRSSSTPSSPPSPNTVTWETSLGYL